MRAQPARGVNEIVIMHLTVLVISTVFINSPMLSSQGMALLTITIGVGVYAFGRVLKPRRNPFPIVPPPPQHAVVLNEDGRPRVRGRAACKELVTSPFTHTPCCYYCAEIEQDLPVLDLFPTAAPYSGGGGWNWSNIHTISSSRDFVLENLGSQVLISPLNLPVQDVPVTFEYQVPENNRSEEDQALLDYVTKNCPDKLKTRFAKFVQSALVSEEQAANPACQQKMQQWRKRRERMFERRTKGQRFRFRERCILPGGEYSIGAAVPATSGANKQ